MSIPFTKYVDINSSVGGAAAAMVRELIARLITDNDLLPTNSYIEFTSDAAVGAYFGKSSPEYLRAVPYFAFISKSIVSPEKISYWRWTDVDVAPMIFGKSITTTLGQFQAITTGSFNLTLGGVSHDLTAIDFSAVTSFADVAAALQAKIRTETGIQWTAADVTFNSLTNSFNFVGGDAVVANVIVGPAASGVNIVTDIGWGTGAILSNGNTTETITETLTACDAASNNFGSFAFIPSLDLGQVTEATVWNDGQNNKYMYCVAVTLSNYASYSTALIGYSGTALTVQVTEGEYAEQLPMQIFAATNYDAINSVQNYMYQQATLTPSVSDLATSNALDAARTNYYGQTQTAGTLLSFYQRGVLTGTTSDATDMNVYANEVWLQSAAGAAIINLLLALNRVSANNQGRAQLLTTLQTVINQALNNGTISVGRPLTTQQILFINNVTADPNAWYQVQNIGYWYDCVISPVLTSDNRTEYTAIYTLVYTKDDAIRSVSGTHVLI